jgi:hypothetical protein
MSPRAYRAGRSGPAAELARRRRQPSLDFVDSVTTPGIDDGPGKPVHIWARVGRLPLLAAGNADGDIAMLESSRLSVLVHHDDGEREFAYDRGAERALAAAAERGWTVISMRDDFAEIF